MTLIDFLLARIAWDETEIRRLRSDVLAGVLPGHLGPGLEESLDLCATRRQMVEAWVNADGPTILQLAANDPDLVGSTPIDDPFTVIRTIAAFYQRHEDYSDAWRPW